MPIYEYKCGGCGHTFVRLQAIGAETKGLSCPKCESAEVERLVSGFAAGGQKSAPVGCPQGPSPSCGGGFS